MNQTIDHFRPLPPTMKSIVKCEEDGDASSSFLHLPDAIILEILNKLIDLKTLCFCYLVSKRFSSIVLQVDAISFTAPLTNPKIPDNYTVVDVPVPPIISLLDSEPFLYAYMFLTKFEGLKSLCMELPSSSEIGIHNPCLFKWMGKFSSRIESFMFVSPNSIFDRDGLCLKGNGDEDPHEFDIRKFKQKSDISLQCIKDARAWYKMLLFFVKRLPMLEKVSITDSGKRGRLSLSGKKLSELKECLHSTTLETVLNRVKVPYVVSKGYILVLKLPVSGYVMKGVYFCVVKMKDVQGGNDDIMKSEDDGFEDTEEAAYSEAVMEILENHKAAMVTIGDGVLL